MNLSTPSNNPNTNRNPPSPSPSPKTQSECSNCGKASQSGGSHTDTHNHKWAQFHFHHVRLRGVDRLLCTSCVLRLHPSSFCPLCFDHFTPPSPPIHNLTPCSKCSSLTHSHCLPTTTTNNPSSSYLCPPCSDPNFSFFQFQPHAATRLDTRSAAVLLCAARIAAASMAKAAAVARADAERKVREAAAAKKRARDAMEHLAMVEAKAGSIENKSKDGVLSNGNLKSLESVVPKNTINNNNSCSNGVGGGFEERKLEVECRASNANGKENES